MVEFTMLIDLTAGFNIKNVLCNSDAMVGNVEFNSD